MEQNFSLVAISPIDGRYSKKVSSLRQYFSEFGLIKYRVRIELEYLNMLLKHQAIDITYDDQELQRWSTQVIDAFDEQEAAQIKEIERTTNHDVKAVEYYLKTKAEQAGFQPILEFIHFGLTSQDVNNTATPLLLKEATQSSLSPLIESFLEQFSALCDEWSDIPMLAKTHGQPASPTRLGKELQVFLVRLQRQVEQLNSVTYGAKFGGATGNMNAHYVAYPDVDWHSFAAEFVNQKLGLTRLFPTTQIDHYDTLAEYCHIMSRFSTICIDLCRDIWTYISMEYFKQKIKAGEVGSSAMPHKVNPIDFENAEGNLGICIALCEHLAHKLPISRLQRDLTDSTVLRNLGVPLAHLSIAIQSMQKGLGKLLLNQAAIDQDLDQNWAVCAEAIQTILRREGYPKPYEALKALTRQNTTITQDSLHTFIETLDVNQAIKAELKAITPFNFVGK